MRKELTTLIAACSEGENRKQHMSKVVAVDRPAPTANGCVCIQLQYMPHQRHVCLVLGLLRTIRLIQFPVCARVCVSEHEHACVQMHMQAHLDFKQCATTSNGLLRRSLHIFFRTWTVCGRAVSIFAYLKYEIALNIIVPVEKWNL